MSNIFLDGVHEITCPDEYRVIEVNLRGCASPDTAVIVSTCTGSSRFAEHPDEAISDTVFYIANSNEGECPDTADSEVGRFKIHFVKITDTYDPLIKSSWEYIRLPSVRFVFDHASNSEVTISLYNNPGDTCDVNGNGDVGTVSPNVEFSDIDGIGEILIEIRNPAPIESFIEGLYLYSEFQEFGRYIKPDPGLVLLIDTSGSMSWNYLGVGGVPRDESRLGLVERAVNGFLDLMETQLNNTPFNLGFANFPRQPWPDVLPDPWTDLCDAETGISCTLVDTASIGAAHTEMQGLDAKGATPLLAGIYEAITTCEPVLPRVIVILSDGYHNCPNQVTPSDPEVTELLDLLKNKAIKVYTIGFARPEDFDSALLTQLASVTTFDPGSCDDTPGTYYPVTGGYFDLDTWQPGDEPDYGHPASPETALQQVFKEILTDVLGLQPITDPFEIITNEKPIIEEVNICEYDKKVSFYLGWASPTENRLTLQITSSDEQPVQSSEPGIQLRQGAGYIILTVSREFLEKDGKVGIIPWILRIEATGLADGESEKLQYCVLANSDLQLETEIVSPELTPGEDLTLQAVVTENGEPMTGLKDVTVSTKVPEESLGNWYAGTIVSEKDLRSVDLKRGIESPSALQRKAIFMSNTLKNPPPKAIKGPSIQLRESKRQVDSKSKTTFYTRSFSSTKKEGTYSFHFNVSGITEKGIKFKREAKVNRHLRATFSPTHSDIKLIPVSSTKDHQKMRVVLTPRDKHGNHLGPGYGSAIRLSPSIGDPVGTINDDLSGTYSQIISVPARIPSDAKLDVKIQKISTSVRLEPSIAEKGKLFNWFTVLLAVIIAILSIYIVYLGVQP